MTKIKTLDELIQALADLYEDQKQGLTDPEDRHGRADKALLDYIGDHRVTALYDGIEKWYS